MLRLFLYLSSDIFYFSLCSICSYRGSYIFLQAGGDVAHSFSMITYILLYNLCCSALHPTPIIHCPHLVLDTPHHMTLYRDSPHLHINWNTLIYSFFDTDMRLGIPFSNSLALLSFSTIVFILVHCIIRSTNHSSWCVMIWYTYTYHHTLLTVGHFVEEHVLDIN